MQELLEINNVKWLVVVGDNQNDFVKKIEEYGGAEALERDSRFAIFFDTTPVDMIEDMEDYGLVARKYNKSYRVLAQSEYVGNILREDQARYILWLLKYYSVIRRK